MRLDTRAMEDTSYYIMRDALEIQKVAEQKGTFGADC